MMNDKPERRSEEPAQTQPGHPSQAEGEDPDKAGQHPDPRLGGHPSQAEGEDREDDSDG